MELWSILIATVSGTGVTVAAHRARRARARRLALRRRLEQLQVDLPLDVRHLSPALGQVAIQARVVRLVLETPLHRFFDTPLRETPWGRRERCDDYDLAVVEARRALWEWLWAVERLGGAERALLGQLGLGVQRLWAVMRQPGVFERTDDVFEETLYPAAPDPERVTTLLCQAMVDLRGFEVALLSHRPDPYR
ncbi:MAG: hypothetical protein KDK70_08100 [Myxococcales bacterium]|nr:hypothetical protein [Myxococcales bacterium]